MNKIEFNSEKKYLLLNNKRYEWITFDEYKRNPIDGNHISSFINKEKDKHLERYIIQKNIKNYFITGKWSFFVTSINEEVGYKFYSSNGRLRFSLEGISSHTLETIRKIYKIQTILNEGGFATRPLDIVKFNDPFYAIKMEKAIGCFCEPNEEWITELNNFCMRQNITGSFFTKKEYLNKDNCIMTNNGIRLLDIDSRGFTLQEK